MIAGPAIFLNTCPQLHASSSTPEPGRKISGRSSRRLPPRTPMNQEQVNFTSPFPLQPKIAVIGGGLSGLACAWALSKLDDPIASVVFDTGEHGTGGRLATRATADGSLRSSKGGPAPPNGLIFDHAAQYFTATDPTFKEVVAQWEREGIIKEWEGPVGTLRCGVFTAFPSTPARFIAPRGMRSLAEHIATQATAAEIRRPLWVGEAIHNDAGWQLLGRGRSQGYFDAVVISHNGKCANKLCAPMGVPLVQRQLRSLKLSAAWVVMVAFAKPVPVPPGGLEGAFVSESTVLSWAANNTRKLGLTTISTGQQECWTLISTQSYGKLNKVPQENVPAEVAARVTREMVVGFGSALGLAPGEIPPIAYSRAQLWGAALPLNSPRVPCIWDGVGRVGVVGDWVAGGGSLENAFLSGLALAQQIAAMTGAPATEGPMFSMGLTASFKEVKGEDIGLFPVSSGSLAKLPKAKATPKKSRSAGAPARKDGNADKVMRPVHNMPG